MMALDESYSPQPSFIPLFYGVTILSRCESYIVQEQMGCYN